MNVTNETILRLPKVIEITGRGRASIYADMKRGTFPQAIKLGARSVGWTASSIDQWIKERVGAQQAA